MIGGDGVVLFHFGGKGAEREGAIAWNMPNFEDALTELITAKNLSSRITILFDSADQTYKKEENIPKLSFVDRPRFIRRKLELAFPSYPIRAAYEMRPPKKKRGAPADIKKFVPAYLFAAIPETEQLDRVAHAIYESGATVTGFGLLPVESAEMLQEISRKLHKSKSRPSRWSVLIGQHETGGLRQVVIKDGNLALTRLTPTTEGASSGAAWVEEVMREFKATLTYVSRFGYTAEEGLDVTVVCRDIEKQFLNAAAFGSANFACLNQGEALSLIGVRPGQIEKNNYGDVLHAAWIAKRSKLVLPVRVPSIQKSVVPRMVATAAIALLTLAGLAGSAVTVSAALDYRQKSIELEQLRNEKTMLDREYEVEEKKFEGLPVKPDVMKAVMNTKDMMEKSEMEISPILHVIKDAIGQDVTLEKISVKFYPGNDFSFDGAKESKSDRPGNLTFKTIKDRGTVTVAFSFSLPSNMPLEQKVERSEKIKAELQKTFTKHTVTIRSQFGKFDRQGKLSVEIGEEGGVTKDAAGKQAKDVAEIEIKGEPL
jgi:hypothetical protein